MFWPFNVISGGKKLSLVAFDLDNTLCDYASAEAETEVFMANMLHNDISKISRAIAAEMTAMVILKEFNKIKNDHLGQDPHPHGFSRDLWFTELIQNLEKISQHAKNKLSKQNASKLLGKTKYYEKEYWKYFNGIGKLYSNTIYLLEYLKSRGLKVAMVTNSDGERDIKMTRIRALGIEKYFDHVIISDDTGVNKPDISNWESLVKISGCDPKECMMVGDHPDIDLVNAKKLGLITVWTKQHMGLDRGYPYIDYEINDIVEIVNIIQKYSIVKKP